MRAAPMQRAEARRQEIDALVRRAVERAGPLDLEAHEGTPAAVDDPAVRVGAEAVEVLLRQVDAAPVEVLSDVAEEVGELERVAEVARRPRASGCSGSRIGSIISPMTAAEPSM